MTSSEEIKSRLDIVDVIREYIPSLKAVGVNFVALSPFKREKTPSFVVSPEKQIWHCFSTGKGGDIFTFVMEMENLTFVEALRILAQKAGVVLKRENVREQSQKNRLLDIMEEAVIYYHKQLLESSQAISIRQYLVSRGLQEKTIIDWQIGYSPDNWTDLIDFLKKKGFNDKEIFLAGLSAKKEGRNNFYNRFRGRIMFPICDINGNAVAFSARVNPAKAETEVMGKYVNSPETILYSKSKILFGLDKAKRAIKENDLAIVVEGQMDAISAHQAGFNNVIAVSGTALTKEQLKLLKRYSDNIALCFDMDEAGQAATNKGIAEATQEEMNIKIITLPEGKDPDELIRKNPEIWKKSVVDAKHFMQYYFEKTFAHFNVEEIEGKRKSVKVLLPVINRFKNSVEKDFWLKKLSQVIDANETELREELAKIKQKDKVNISAGEEKNIEKKHVLIKKTREEMLSEILLALIIRYPQFFEHAVSRINNDYIFGLDNKIFYKNLIIYYNNNSLEDKKINYNNLKSYLESKNENNKDNQLKLLDKLVVLGEKDFFDLEISQAKNEIIKIGMDLKNLFLIERKREIEKLIAQMEKEGKVEEVKNLMEEFKLLMDESEKNLMQKE